MSQDQEVRQWAKHANRVAGFLKDPPDSMSSVSINWARIQGKRQFAVPLDHLAGPWDQK